MARGPITLESLQSNNLRLEVRMEEGFERMEGGFERTSELFKYTNDKMDRKFAEVDTRFAEVDKRFDEVDKRFDEVMFRLDQSDARARNRDIFKASQSIQYVPHVGRKALEKPKGFPDTVAKFWGLKRCRESLQISSPYSNSLLPKPNTSRHCATSIDTLTTRHELLNR
jgi:hypothetical protein